MTLAKHPHEIAVRIHSLLEADRVGLNTLGILDLFYGVQDKIARTPTVMVEAGDTTSPLAGVPNMVQRQHECTIIVFHAKYGSNETTKLEAEQYAAAIADFLDSNLQLNNASNEDPLVIHGWVVRNSPGYLPVGNDKYRAVQLTWQGISKTRLGA
jgi:hypothetical protein